ncbi:MAG: beta-ketoacyl-[acyl-carrier-protein] synthase family protein, partial [Desulfovibrio sp.]|nr:beta-ketoacyl-[acyl-carrier-protein] synthase family protein [Desulfovibrio sp.]
MSSSPRFAVTGIGAVATGVISADGIWRVLNAPPAQLAQASVLHPQTLPFPFFSVPEDAFGPEGRRRNALDTLSLARIATREALSSSGFEPGKDGRLGIAVGTTSGSALHFFDSYATLRKLREPDPKELTVFFGCNPALELAREFHAEGPVTTLSNACTSGADAIGAGLDFLRAGMCDAVLCGGADALSLVPHTGFARLMIYSDEPCRPFDARRKGLNLGEGSGMLLLESEASARRRDVAIRGFIAGYGSACDAHHFTAPHPEARGLALAVDRALAEAGVEASGIAFINAHATANRENDRTEGKFLASRFPGKPVWASKAV